jgi:hypothetical protein
MPSCDFATIAHPIANGWNRSFKLYTDQCDVESHRVIEVPLRGPDPATTLAIVSGIAVANVDIAEGYLEGPTRELGFELFILTDYVLKADERYLDGGVYAWLSAITDDDHLDRTAARIEEVEVEANAERRIQVHVKARLQGDMLVARVGYQAFVVVEKPRAFVTPTRPFDASRHAGPLIADAQVRLWRPVS